MLHRLRTAHHFADYGSWSVTTTSCTYGSWSMSIKLLCPVHKDVVKFVILTVIPTPQCLFCCLTLLPEVHWFQPVHVHFPGYLQLLSWYCSTLGRFMFACINIFTRTHRVTKLNIYYDIQLKICKCTNIFKVHTHTHTHFRIHPVPSTHTHAQMHTHTHNTHTHRVTK